MPAVAQRQAGNGENYYTKNYRIKKRMLNSWANYIQVQGSVIYTGERWNKRTEGVNNHPTWTLITSEVIIMLSNTSLSCRIFFPVLTGEVYKQGLCIILHVLCQIFPHPVASNL